MDSSNFGMFFSEGNNSDLKSKVPSTTVAPWIAQLKSVFEELKDKVTAYATKDNSFNDMGEEIEKVARIYFVVNGEEYRIFGFAKGVGEKGRAAFAKESIDKIIKANPGKAFEVNKEKNENEVKPFIDLVQANGNASQIVIDDFIKLRDVLLGKLGI